MALPSPFSKQDGTADASVVQVVRTSPSCLDGLGEVGAMMALPEVRGMKAP